MGAVLLAIRCYMNFTEQEEPFYAWLALDRTKVTQFTMHNASPEEAIEQLGAVAATAGLASDRLRFRLVPWNETDNPALRWVDVRTEKQPDGSERIVEVLVDAPPSHTRPAVPPIPGLESIPGWVQNETLPVLSPLPPASRISVALTNPSLLDVISTIASNAGLEYHIAENEVSFYPSGVPRKGLLLFRRQSVPWFFGPGSEPKLRTDMRPFLQEAGIDFCEGAKAEYLPEKDVILTLLPVEQGDLAQSFLTPSCCGGPLTLLDRIKMHLPPWLQF